MMSLSLVLLVVLLLLGDGEMTRNEGSGVCGVSGCGRRGRLLRTGGGRAYCMMAEIVEAVLRERATESDLGLDWTRSLGWRGRASRVVMGTS